MTDDHIASPTECTAKPRFQRHVGRLVKSAALAASVLAFASAASAAECINGYRTLGNQVIVLCEAPSDARALFQPAAPVAEAPSTTPETAPRRSGRIMVDSIEDCQPGLYWTYFLEDGEVTLAC